MVALKVLSYSIFSSASLSSWSKSIFAAHWFRSLQFILGLRLLYLLLMKAFSTVRSALVPTVVWTPFLLSHTTMTILDSAMSALFMPMDAQNVDHTTPAVTTSNPLISWWYSLFPTNFKLRLQTNENNPRIWQQSSKRAMATWEKPW